MMKNNLCVLLSGGALFFACCLPNANVFAAATATHARASSLESQSSLDEGPHIAQIEHVDSIYNIAHSSEAMFSVQKAGTYFVIATGQAGVNIVAPPGYLDLWLVRNETPVHNSAARVYLANTASTSVVTSQAILTLNRGDVISVGYESSNSSIGLMALPPLFPNEPAIPSLHLSIMLIKP